MNIAILLQAIANGIMVGGIYSLIGMSLTIIYGVMKVINFCQGELLMLGMYCTYVLNSTLGLDPFVAIPIVAVVMFLFGTMLQATLITRSIRADDDDTNVLFLTAGFGILFSSAMQVMAAYRPSKKSRCSRSSRSSSARMNTVRSPETRVTPFP